MSDLFMNGADGWASHPYQRPTTPYSSKEMCHSTKRTHFVSYHLSMDHFYLEELVAFAVGFANGFVREKRSHFWSGGTPGKVLTLWLWNLLD